MKEQLITFETAKLAKEKGFDEATQYFYPEWDDIGSEVYVFYGCGLGRDSKEAERSSYLKGFGKILKVSTQSLLQRWLREKHNLHLNCMYSNKHEINGYFYGVIEFKKSEDCLIYDTYEEALEKGLKEALSNIQN